MSRLIGWAILSVGAILVFMFLFADYSQLTNRYRSTAGGGLTQVSIECPAAIQTVVFDSLPDSERDHETCRMSARGRLIEGGFYGLAAVLVSWASITRHRPQRIEPLSRLIEREKTSSP